MQKCSSFMFLVLMIVFFSCTDEGSIDPKSIECESEPINLDTIFLDQESISYISYTGNETLIFKNEVGDEARFEPPQLHLNHIWLTTQFKLLCNTGDTNEYIFKKELYSFGKKCEILDLHMSLTIIPQNSQQVPQFTDELNLFLYGESSNSIFDTTISLGITTSLRGNEDFSDPIRLIGYKTGFVSDTSLLNVAFQNVYYTVKPAGNILPSIFYTEQQGLIAFQDLEDVLWVFDRVQ